MAYYNHHRREQLGKTGHPSLYPLLSVQVETNSSWEGTVFEDPSLWQDSEGHFHILCHAYKLGEERSNCDNSTVSAHLFSLDGLAWSLSPDQPYSTRIRTLQGGEITTLTVSTR